jgi:hypothetical protein
MLDLMESKIVLRKGKYVSVLTRESIAARRILASSELAETGEPLRINPTLLLIVAYSA